MEKFIKINNSLELKGSLPFGEKLETDPFLSSEIMNKIICEIYNDWPGTIGIERVIEKVNFILSTIPQYAKVMEKTELETLELFAKARNVNYTNWFQEATFPNLSDVMVFDTIADLKDKFPSKQYQCPCCGGISTDYQVCNTGNKVGKGKKTTICNWKVYGLFGDMGKGVKVLIKDMFSEIPKPIAMFKPIELL